MCIEPEEHPHELEDGGVLLLVACMSVGHYRFDAADGFGLVDAGRVHQPGIDGLVRSLGWVRLLGDVQGLHEGIGDALVLEGKLLRTKSGAQQQ